MRKGLRKAPFGQGAKYLQKPPLDKKSMSVGPQLHRPTFISASGGKTFSLPTQIFFPPDATKNPS